MAYKKRATARRPSRQTKVPKSVKTYVKKQISRNSELKEVTYNFTEVSEGTSSFNVKYVNEISEGTGPNQRIGNDIALQGLQIKGMVTNTVSIPLFMRTIVLYSKGVDQLSAGSIIWKNNIGDASTTSTIGLGASSANLMIQPIDKSTVGTVLYDKVVRLSPSTATDGTQTKMYNHFIKLNNRKVRYPYGAAGLNTPSQYLQVITLYSEAPQDFSVASVVEHSTYYSLWYRDS